jgi:hypothetical protein
MSVRGFRVGIMCEERAAIARTFLERNAFQLAASGVEVGVLVLDEDPARKQTPLRHLWRLGRRQARIARTSTLVGVLRLLVYRTVMTLGPTRSPGEDEPRPLPESLHVVLAASLNAPAAVSAIQDARCDLICLMGARILTAKTLETIGAPIVNIHSSDPRWVRGGPVVVWEVLDGRPQIVLVVHEVGEALDAGPILAQGSQRLLYRGGLRATTEATMAVARTQVTDLFASVIRDYQVGSVRKTAFAPGELRVTPRVGETLRAELQCRLRSRRSRRILR